MSTSIHLVATDTYNESAYQRFIEKLAEHLLRQHSEFYPLEPLTEAEALKDAKEIAVMYRHQFREFREA